MEEKVEGEGSGVGGEGGGRGVVGLEEKVKGEGSGVGGEGKGYTRPEHPVQLRMRSEVARWAGLKEDRLRTGVDGCGVVCFGMAIEEMAGAYARLGSAAQAGTLGPKEVVDAMVGHPFMVAGTGRLCTRLMEATEGRLFAKVGAEGVYCVGVREEGLGIAVKAEDGARRAAEVAILRALELLGLLSPSAQEILADEIRVPVRNARGEIAAVLEADFELTRGRTRFADHKIDRKVLFQKPDASGQGG